MSWVEAELREQPAALQRFLDAEALNAQEITHRLLRADVRYLLIVSRGSSSNVARYMQYLFGTVNRLPVAFATPSLYTVYDAPPELGPAAVIGISQSGASPDVVAVIAEARKQGRPTLAITNDPSSPLALAADHTLPLHAGEERAVAATKTYLNSIAAVALLSTAGDPRRLDELLAMPGKVARADRRLARRLGKARPIPRHGGRKRRRAWRQLRRGLRDRAQDPRALRGSVRGVLLGRPAPRPDRRVESRSTGDRRSHRRGGR